MGTNSGSGPASSEPSPGYVLRPYRGHHDHQGMAAVRLGCAQRDGIDTHSVVEGIPTVAEIAESCAELDDPSENQVLVERGGGIVGYSTIRWWLERDGTWLYLHRPESRRLGRGRTLLLEGLRCLREHGARTARLYTGTANPHRSYDLYESVGFRRQNEYVRYRKSIAVRPDTGVPKE
ncbi:N-acetyltransferase family protein [Streptomyces mutabilis]|uniref:GNAT family N-acetyltransferase n=1 Tax=Streptomyces mutabilis TaxID=67332 RepID=UPI003F4DAA2A